MTLRRGAALTTAATLGHADTADLGPTAGNGFRTRWPDDLAALQDLAPGADYRFFHGDGSVGQFHAFFHNHG